MSKQMTPDALAELARQFLAVVMIGIWFAGHIKVLYDGRPKQIQVRPGAIKINVYAVAQKEQAAK